VAFGAMIARTGGSSIGVRFEKGTVRSIESDIACDSIERFVGRDLRLAV
jgi:hypothetical protein